MEEDNLEKMSKYNRDKGNNEKMVSGKERRVK